MSIRSFVKAPPPVASIDPKDGLFQATEIEKWLFTQLGIFSTNI
jgi:hypothetical protein